MRPGAGSPEMQISASDLSLVLLGKALASLDMFPQL